MAGHKDAGTGVLLVARRSGQRDRGKIVARRDRQQQPLRPLQLLVEALTRRRLFEVVAIQRFVHRQGGDDAQAEVHGDLGHELVAPFGER
jgi:hypothetical protein